MLYGGGQAVQLYMQETGAVWSICLYLNQEEAL